MDFWILTLLFVSISVNEILTQDSEELKIAVLSKCPIQVEPVGCYGDKAGDRGLPEQVINSRDVGSKVFMKPNLDQHWNTYLPFLSNFICECAKRVVEENRGEYLGIQYYAECWSGMKDIGTQRKSQYDKHGKSVTCRNTQYQRTDDTRTPCEPYCGEGLTNYVYRIKPYTMCPEYFQPVGCFHDNQQAPRPLANYIMNEREPALSNWNGRVIDWNKWDEYMPGLICRCAIMAKSRGFAYFGIQFYGECWAGNDEKAISKDGEASPGDCLHKLGMPPFGEFCPSRQDDNMTLGCQPSLCVGKQLTNRVYERKQGPLSCLKNPCKKDETCKPISISQHECVEA